MNTQNIKELEDSQNTTISKWDAKLLAGIRDGIVNAEDSMPEVNIMGKFDKESGLKFAQELSNAMDIGILINRIETWYKKEESVLYLIYDINPKQRNELPVEPNLFHDKRFGLEITPQTTKKLKM